MIKLEDVLKDVGFNEKDKENMKKIAPIIQEHKDEIVDETVNIFLKDPEVAKIVQENNVSISVIKDIFRGNLELIFFPPRFGEEYEKRVYKCVKTCVSNLGLRVDFAVLLMSLLLIKGGDKLSSLKLDNFADLSETTMKLLSVFSVLRVGLYNEELLSYFLKFTGMSEALFERGIRLQIKKEFDKNS